MLTVITINKNNTAIAPMYTIKINNPKKSAFNKIKIKEPIKKERIKNKTDVTGLSVV